jgi:hypothetical protein
MCHLQDFGDSETYKNGEFCGTRGQSRRVEGMQVWITPVNTEQTTTQVSTVDVVEAPTTEETTASSDLMGTIMVHLENIGDKTYDLSEFAGTRGQSRRLEGFQINIDSSSGDPQLEYMAHLEGTGDVAW